jgi:hypothetical protein
MATRARRHDNDLAMPLLGGHRFARIAILSDTGRICHMSETEMS